jgi:hypothetical protein
MDWLGGIKVIERKFTKKGRGPEGGIYVPGKTPKELIVKSKPRIKVYPDPEK